MNLDRLLYLRSLASERGDLAAVAILDGKISAARRAILMSAQPAHLRRAA